MAQVCPDRQLLSVYFDGELPSPWKEKLESHVAGCSDCGRRLEEYRRISPGRAAAAAGEGDAEMEAARERVWRKLEAVQDHAVFDNAAFGRYPARTAAWGRGVWQRSISIPIPAAAAILLLIALAFLLVLRTTGTEGMSAMTFASEAELDAPGIIPTSSMEDVLQYLGSRDNGEIIILRLPESRSFVNYGEPAIIKAADYSRTMPGRRKP